MTVQSIIATRRDGKDHSQEELIFLANGAAKGLIPDYQLAAWLMAAYLNPLSEQETAWLTLAMADSGVRLDLTGLPKPWVDKHSTGGVGDKTSIVLLPLLAACGLTVVKMSGRGLGITGGTVDKLGSIPGFRLDLTPEEMKSQANEMGLALTGQTPDLAPADKVLYSLRDATATVSSVPLIVSSILSKKLAGGAETIVLDVKCGAGAFMNTREEAQVLARSLTRTAELCGLNIRIAITDMQQPLGSAVGNALEVAEAIRVLDGEQSRFARLCVRLAGLTLVASGIEPSQEPGEKAARDAITDGTAKRKAVEWFLAQGATGDVTAPDFLPRAPSQFAWHYNGEPNWVSKIDARTIGQIVLDLGGGRQAKEDIIDPSVGLELHVEVGSRLVDGQPLATIHARSQSEAESALTKLKGALEYSASRVEPYEALLIAY